MAKWEKSPGEKRQGLAKRVLYLNDWLFTKFQRPKNRHQNASWNDFKYTSFSATIWQFARRILLVGNNARHHCTSQVQELPEGGDALMIHILTSEIQNQAYLQFWIFNMCNFQPWCELTCFQANLLEGCCFHFACLLLYVFRQVCLCTWQNVFASRVGTLWNSLGTQPQFDSMSHAEEVISKPADSFIRDCNKLRAFTLHLLIINLCQPPIRVTGTRAKLRVWRPRPSSAEAFLAFAWNIHSQPPNHGPC